MNVNLYTPLRLLVAMVFPFTFTIVYLYNKAYGIPDPILCGIFIAAGIFAYRMATRKIIALGLYLFLGVLGVIVAWWRFDSYTYTYQALAPNYFGKNVTIMGEITSFPQQTFLDGKAYWKVEFNVHAASSGKESASGRPVPAGGCVLVYLLQGENKGPSILYAGDQLFLRGDIRPMHFTFEEGQMDLRSRRYDAGVVGSVFEPQVITVHPASERKPIRILNHWRNRLTASIQHYLPGQKGVLLESLLFGAEYATLSPVITESFSRTGLIHILSVSGSHITVLLGATLWILQKFGFRKRKAVWIGVACVIVYGLLVGGSAPVVRAISTGLLGAVGTFLGRRYVALQGLTLVYIANLLWNPLALADISFQFSYGASYGILLFCEAFTNRLQGIREPLRSLFGITVTAQIFVLPIQIYYFHMISLSVFLSNILVGPLLEGVITVGLFLIALVMCLEGILHNIGLFMLQDMLQISIVSWAFHTIGIVLEISFALVVTLSQVPLSVLTIRAWFIPECLGYYLSIVYLYRWSFWKETTRRYLTGVGSIVIIVIVMQWYFPFGIYAFPYPTFVVRALQTGSMEAILLQRKGQLPILYLAASKETLLEKRSQERIRHFLIHHGVGKVGVIYMNTAMFSLPSLTIEGKQSCFSILHGQSFEKSLKLTKKPLEGVAMTGPRWETPQQPCRIWFWPSRYGRDGQEFDVSDDRYAVAGREILPPILIH